MKLIFCSVVATYAKLDLARKIFVFIRDYIETCIQLIQIRSSFQKGKLRTMNAQGMVEEIITSLEVK